MFTPVMEFVSVSLPKDEIETILGLGPDVWVTASQLTEDGIDLVLEGPALQVYPVISELKKREAANDLDDQRVVSGLG